MQRLKKLIVVLMAVVMACVCSVTLFGCAKEDIKKMEVKIAVYNFESSGTTETYTMSIDLYRHLAPNTVDAIVKYVNEGYYNNKVFYKDAAYSNQLMIGDLRFTAGETENSGFSLDEKPTIEGEFKYGGTTGSNLTAKKGSIGLWRSWLAQDEGQKDNRNATDTGRATWFIPTTSISSYNDYFCIFAQYDVNNSGNADAIAALTDAFDSSANYEEYVIYYTGEYENLTFNCVAKEDFDEESLGDDLFKAEGAQLMCYNHYTVRVPMHEGDVAAKIVSAKIVG